MTTSDSSFCEIKYKYFKGNYTLKLCSIGSSFKCNRGTSEWPGSLVATPCVTRRIRRHGVDCLCCSQWLMQMQWQVTPLNFAPFLFCGLFQKNQRRPAQPDLPDRLRVRRWKGVSMTATLIQPAPGYYYQVPGKWNGTKQRKIWDCCSDILTEIRVHQNIQDQDVALDGRTMFQDEERWISVLNHWCCLQSTWHKSKQLSLSWKAFFNI